MALEFCILNASRSGEVLGATWPEIDRRANVWTIPAGRMKGGIAHRVPLSVRALEILDAAEMISKRDFIFPGRKSGQPLSHMALDTTLKRMNVEGVTVHGFRSSFRDWPAKQPASLGRFAALAHVVGDETERAYRRGDALQKRRKLMEAWSSYCDGQSGVVLPFTQEGGGE